MSTHRILVVDDDPSIRSSVSEVLADEGYEVDCAENGRIALDYLRTSSAPPCLILLDLMMPVMNGWEFCQAKDADPSLRAIPIVVLSAFGQTAAARLCAAAEFLAKPVKLDNLLRSIEKHC